MSATAELWSRPVDIVIAAAAMVAVAVGGGYALRRSSRLMRSLRQLVIATTIASLAVGAVTALVLVRVMVLDGGEARAVLVVLLLAAAFAAGLAAIASAPLGRDVATIERAVRRVEAGDRAARSGVARADELGHLAAALDALNGRLGELETERQTYDSERQAMLTSIGHDLRTPLAALQATVEALTDGVAPDPPRYLRAMSHNIAVLSRLVDDLFLVARIESSQLALESTRLDLAEIADEAIEALRPAAQARAVEVRLVTEGPVPVDGDRSALGRVIRNLLDNAIRHSPPESTVRVEMGTDPPTVRVVDEGEGFDAAFVGQAFHHFARSDRSRTRSTGGAGLGLTIAKGLIEAHAGEILIEGPPGGRVRMRLPSPDSEASLSPAGQRPSAGGTAITPRPSRSSVSPKNAS